MGERVKIPIFPGGEKSDIEETKLGIMEHQLVKNWKIEREGEWKTVKGYVNSKTGLSDVRVAIEVTDDLSGDRFILFQSGYGSSCLKRLDYDDGDGDGYENETPSTLTLPSGVTIGDLTLRFFYFRGVVRITGGSEPLWYGYIDRTLLSDAWEDIDMGEFDDDTENWSGNSATLSQYDSLNDPDGIGNEMVNSPNPTKCLKVIQTANTGSARKSYTVENGKTIRVVVLAFRASGGTGNIQVKIGNTAGGSEYETLSSSTEDEWVMLESSEFTATSNTLHIELIPSAGAANDTAYFDFIYIEQKCNPIVINGWFLKKCSIESIELKMNLHKYISAPSTERGLFAKNFSVYDDSQFSLIDEFNLEDLVITYGLMDENILEGMEGIIDYANIGRSVVDIEIYGSDLENNFINERINRIGLSIGVLEEGVVLAEDDVPYYVTHDIDLSEDLEDIRFAALNFHTHPDKLYTIYIFAETGYEYASTEIGYLRKGLRIKLTTEDGSIDSIVTYDPGQNSGHFRISHHVSELGTDGSPDAGGYYDMHTCVVVLTRKWFYDSSSGYETRLAFDPQDLLNEFYEYSDIPSGTTDINPNYSHHCVAAEKGYILSLEDEEEDIIRYSPEYQYDVFPNGNIMQTEIGDTDQNLALINRDERIVVLKKNSISQMQFSGGRFYFDIGLEDHGLFAERGYFCNKNELYYMEEDDFYLFMGGKPIPLMMLERNRKFYKDHVDENSIVGYRKLENEIWLILNGAIMVYQINFKNWYQRETDISPICIFKLINNKTYFAASDKFVTYDHNESTFDENIGCQIISRLHTNGSQNKWKKAIDFETYSKGNGDLSLIVSDPNIVSDGGSYWTEDITPDTDEVNNNIEHPNYLFKTAEFHILNKTDANDLDLTLREAQLIIDRMGS